MSSRRSSSSGGRGGGRGRHSSGSSYIPLALHCPPVPTPLRYQLLRHRVAALARKCWPDPSLTTTILRLAAQRIATSPPHRRARRCRSAWLRTKSRHPGPHRNLTCTALCQIEAAKHTSVVANHRIVVGRRRSRHCRCHIRDSSSASSSRSHSHSRRRHSGSQMLRAVPRHPRRRAWRPRH